MTRKPTHLRGLIPFMALPLFWSCQNDPLGPEDPQPEPLLMVPAEEPEHGRLELFILPAEANLRVGDHLEVQHFFREGDEVFPAPPVDIQWEAEDPDVAIVSEDGLVQALAPGTTRIRAESERGSSHLMIRVRRS